jgi:NADP-dependent 3-hydroxy acid dehydrogenase YdfG
LIDTKIQAFVPSFAKAGAKVIVLVARDADRLKKSEAEFKSTYPGTQFLSVACDVSDVESVASVFQEVKSTIGHPDVLVNNAGVSQANGNVKDVDPLAWWKEMVNSASTPH